MVEIAKSILKEVGDKIGLKMRFLRALRGSLDAS